MKDAAIKDLQERKRLFEVLLDGCNRDLASLLFSEERPQDPEKVQSSSPVLTIFIECVDERGEPHEEGFPEYWAVNVELPRKGRKGTAVYRAWGTAEIYNSPEEAIAA